MSLLVAALLLVSDPVAQPATAQAPAQPAKPQKERKICKVDPARTGSHMSKRKCLTQAEWDDLDQGKNAGDLKTMGAQ
jgi:hypothetical protein